MRAIPFYRIFKSRPRVYSTIPPPPEVLPAEVVPYDDELRNAAMNWAFTHPWDSRFRVLMLQVELRGDAREFKEYLSALQNYSY